MAGRKSQKMITATTSLIRAADFLACEVDGELVMMDVKNGHYFNLDIVGADIWNRLEKPLSLGELCAILEQSYEADAETIVSDVHAFVEKMLEHGLLQQAG
jgi:hypothetical protein